MVAMSNYSPSAVLAFFAAILVAAATDFDSEKGSSWGGAERVKISENGTLLQLQLDQASDSGYQFKNQYLYGRFDMRIKVVPGNSAGTVTAYYLQSPRPNHNEIDFQFLGNVSQSEPYVLHTNLWVRDTDDRVQEFYLWFDPREDFHTYSVLWNPHHIVWLVDDIPIRVYRNIEGIPYPDDQPLSIFTNISNGQEWATRRGKVGIDWSQSPFRAWFRDFNIDACVVAAASRAISCPVSSSNWMNRTLTHDETSKVQWVREYYMIRDYCHDPGRFLPGVPSECSDFA